MFCIKCGAQLPDDIALCSACGADLKEELKSISVWDAESVATVPEQSAQPECLHSFNNMNYEEDLIAKKQLKKARRLADATLGTGIAAICLLILGVVLIPLFWFLWFFAFMLGIASFVLSFLSKRAMYELMYNDLYEMQIKKVKITYRKGKTAAAIAMISTIVGAVAIVFALFYFATELLQSDFTEAVQLLWNLLTNAISKLF